MLENLFLVRRVGEFAREVLRGEVQLLVQIGMPFGAIGDIINDAFVRDKLSCAALARIAAEFCEGDEAGGDVHAADYNRAKTQLLLLGRPVFQKVGFRICFFTDFEDLCFGVLLVSAQYFDVRRGLFQIERDVAEDHFPLEDNDTALVRFVNMFAPSLPGARQRGLGVLDPHLFHAPVDEGRAPRSLILRAERRADVGCLVEILHHARIVRRAGIFLYPEFVFCNSKPGRLHLLHAAFIQPPFDAVVFRPDPVAFVVRPIFFDDLTSCNPVQNIGKNRGRLAERQLLDADSEKFPDCGHGWILLFGDFIARDADSAETSLRNCTLFYSK